MPNKLLELRFRTETKSKLQVTDQELIAIILRKLAQDISDMEEKQFRYDFFQNIVWDDEIIGVWRYK